MEKEQEYVLAAEVQPGNPPIKDGAYGTEVDGGGGALLSPSKRQGHLCCGGCCDMRRATMIVNYVNIGFLMLGLWAMTALAATAKRGGQYMVVDDDLMEEAYTEIAELKGFGLIVTFMVFRLICNALGIYGAHTYNVTLVSISLVAYAVEFLFGLLRFDLVGLVVAGCFAYPHVYFIREVRSGIMSPQNYPLEQHSCCCV